MKYAKSYAEHVRTGKLFLEPIPDQVKWSFMKVWDAVDEQLRNNLDLDNDDEFNTQHNKYAKIMRIIFETTNYSKLIRKVYHTKLLYQEELGTAVTKGGSLEWLSLKDLVKNSSPFNDNHCPLCGHKEEEK